MATGTVNTLRQVGVAVGVAALGAIFTNRTGSAATSDLAGQTTPTQIGELADAIASGAGTKVTAAVPEPMRAALAHVARGATSVGLNSVLIGSDKNRTAVPSSSGSQPANDSAMEPAP